MTPSPDIAGFREAQARLRQKMGQDVAFSIPETPQWAPGVQLDPETGRPYDPTIEPTAGGGFTTVTHRVSVIFRPIRGRLQDETEATAMGIVSDDTAALLMDPADYPSVESAVKFDLNGTDYKITEAVPDGLAGVDRYVVFGEAL